MPNFGFNPFAPRINVFTTGVDAGDSRRYYSRDVIRGGMERVAIDATLTPGEPGKRQKTQFEKEVTEMVQQEREVPFDKRKKLQFVDAEKIHTADCTFDGLRTYDEFVQLKAEDTRRRELSRYHLDEVDYL